MTPPADNPLLAPWNTPFGLPPFAEIRPEHFVPAFDAALAAHRAEIDAIADADRGADVRQHHGRVRPQRARRSAGSSGCSST